MLHCKLHPFKGHSLHHLISHSPQHNITQYNTTDFLLHLLTIILNGNKSIVKFRKASSSIYLLNTFGAHRIQQTVHKISNKRAQNNRQRCSYRELSAFTCNHRPYQRQHCNRKDEKVKDGDIVKIQAIVCRKRRKKRMPKVCNHFNTL